ncbi:MAG: type IV pili methyl-accepting chemotaxis transducer N-terminal domain-containing protein [Betaproteobacteria bacterium]|nr:type IV pili methyl-accepting chemotaxis transducer N-terminal domain-containing protein [Betaproteobacteria bacterium]
MPLPNFLTTKSILGRLGLLMGAIVILAIVSIMVSTIFTELAAGKARAINLAGSLRMQAYAIEAGLGRPAVDAESGVAATAKSIAAFAARLDNPALQAGLNPELARPLHERYLRVRDRWSQEIRPGAEAAAVNPQARGSFALALDSFVADIDTLVQLMEQDLEGKIQWLRLVQGVSLFAIVVVVLVTMYIMHMQVLVPLLNLLACARAAREGEFRTRAEHTGDDELGQLGEAFNVMMQDLAHMYANLEARVQEKTDALARSTQSLELLYRITRDFSTHEIGPELLKQVLAEVEGLVHARAGAVCVGASTPALPLASMPPVAAGAASMCGLSDCARCLGDGSLRLEAALSDGARLLSIPLTDQGRQYGVMPLALPPDLALQDWQEELLEAVGRHLGAALALAQRSEERHRLALFEERSVIARELHDSLAQSLSYLKIQVARLQMNMKSGSFPQSAQEVVIELKTGLASAYRQLRELLTTFRLRIDGRGLPAAIEDTVLEFQRRGQFAVALDNRLTGLELASNEEIHVLQVIREALSNVEHHAQAASAWIRLERLPDQRVRVQVDDDGKGIRAPESPTHHYGLVIMRDRAASLGGQCRVFARPEGGTRVELEFAPATPYREPLPSH